MTRAETLNLYALVADDPESFADLDGHDYICIPCAMKALKKLVANPRAQTGVKGAAKIVVGSGLVLTAAGGDVPGGVAGTLLIANAAFAGGVTATSGMVDATAAITNSGDIKKASEALDGVKNLPALVTTAATGGNFGAGSAVGTLADAGTLAAAPKEAVKNLATAADAINTVGDTAGLFTQLAQSLRGAISGSPPPPPPPPQPHPPCSTAAGGPCDGNTWNK